MPAYTQHKVFHGQSKRDITVYWGEFQDSYCHVYSSVVKNPNNKPLLGNGKAWRK